MKARYPVKMRKHFGAFWDGVQVGASFRSSGTNPYSGRTAELYTAGFEWGRERYNAPALSPKGSASDAVLERAGAGEPLLASEQTSTPAKSPLVDFLRRHRRQASLLQIGGFRPPEDPAATWVGRVRLAAPGETWPTFEGKRLAPLAQLNLTEAPYVPPNLQDLEMLTVFRTAEPPMGGANGQGWLVRGYPSIADLVEIDDPPPSDPFRPFPGRWTHLEADYPSWEFVADEIEITDEVSDEWSEIRDDFCTAQGTKIGGWPYPVQHEIGWGDPAIDYVLQFDTEAKAEVFWVDRGIAYLGRQGARWSLAVQFL